MSGINWSAVRGWASLALCLMCAALAMVAAFSGDAARAAAFVVTAAMFFGVALATD